MATPEEVAVQAAYGTDRADTRPLCDDGNSSSGMLFNWNLLLLHADPFRDIGVFTGRALADGVACGWVRIFRFSRVLPPIWEATGAVPLCMQGL